MRLIANSDLAEWLITSTTDPLDDMEKTFITAFLDHLNKQAGAGGMHSQPQTTFDISKALVDYCIGAYDRITEGGHRRSVRQIFFQSINDMVRFLVPLTHGSSQSKKTSTDGACPGHERNQTLRKIPEEH